MSDSPKSVASGDSDGPSLPALVARLGDDIVSLVDSKLTLLKIEIEEDVRAYGRGLVAMGVAGIVGAVGFALLNVALAFVVADLLRGTPLSQPMQHAIGFAATGLVYLLVGTTIAIRARDRLAKHDPKPEKTLEELEKDKRWLKRESE